jgi:P pilus assembly chaperone PapD
VFGVQISRKTFGILSALLLSVSAPITAAAFEVQPMRHSLFPMGGQNSSLFTVKNTRQEPLPVEIVVAKRVFEDDGTRSEIPADEDFVVFPFQALIQPGATQAFRFQYVGDLSFDEEVSYTIHAKEVPVDPGPGFSGLRYVYSFGVAVYVEDAEAESDLSITNVTRSEDVLNLTLENAGSSFARLTNDRIILIQGETRLELEGEDLSSKINTVIVPPNGKADLQLDLTDLELTDEQIGVQIRERSD